MYPSSSIKFVKFKGLEKLEDRIPFDSFHIGGIILMSKITNAGEFSGKIWLI